MAERTILGIFLLLSLYQTYAALDVSAPSTQRALFTSDTNLNCSFSLDKQPMDPNFLVISWTFQGKVILRYDKKDFSTQDPRISLNMESLRDGYASLHISNVTISDRGTYICTVIYNAESKKKEISFKVFARPLLSIPSTKVQRNIENTLTCKATGFFPPDILITWYRNGEALRNHFMGKPQVYKDGTYHVDSTMTITPTNDDQNQTFFCRVQHESLQEPLQKALQLIYEETSLNLVAVVCGILVVIIIIIAGIGIFLLKRKHRKTDVGSFTVMDIEGPTKLIAGEEISLCCRATNCSENTSVSWLEKRGGQVCGIPESHGRDKEEEKRLMGTQYEVISCRDGPNFTSSLKFRPSVAKDVTFICRYSCGKEKKEKTFHCRAIYAKPQLLLPVSRSLIVPGELKYLITLEKFYPRNITITWTHGVGEPQQALSSTETLMEIPDGTYNICSEVRIPEEFLKDPESRVRVSWKQETLEILGYKDLSIRDSEYPWTPEVEEIQTPNVFHDTPVTLQCHISKYFPNAITVTWLRKNKNQELCVETDNIVSNTIPSGKGDNTYSCTASLTITPTLSVHQGAEYTCLVTHPSLKRSIERRTKKLAVKAKPQMEGSIKITMGDSSYVRFTLNLLKFYPQDIEVKWRYEYKGKQSEIQCHNSPKKKDPTYGVTSVCNIPMKFDDPQTKVSVTWKHESMDEPETRTLTVRDLPWRPQIGEIIIPKLEEDKKESLTCNISGYFPDILKVSWFKKETGKDLQANVAPVSKDAYKVSSDKKELKDKTFSYMSILTFTPSFSRDQGAEFICRVEHPSLEHPIERRTSPITIDLPCPQVGEINIPTLEEDKEATLTCDISGPFPKYITVSWYRKEPGTDSQPSITPLPNDNFKIRKMKNKTGQPSLIFTPSLRRDQGAEFICRVEHPSLEKPIEKSTGPIKLTKHSGSGTVKAQQKASS